MSPADICHYALVNGGDVLAAAAAGPLEISMAAGSPRKQDEVAFSGACSSETVVFHV